MGKVATASSGVATYPVTIDFDDTTGHFNAGATVEATISYAEVANAIQVPSLAVRQGSDGATVVVANGEKRTTRDVTTGLSANGMVQITAGLTANESVVVQVPSFRTAGATRDQGDGSAGNGSGPPAGVLPGAPGVGG